MFIKLFVPLIVLTALLVIHLYDKSVRYVSSRTVRILYIVFESMLSLLLISATCCFGRLAAPLKQAIGYLILLFLFNTGGLVLWTIIRLLNRFVATTRWWGIAGLTIIAASGIITLCGMTRGVREIRIERVTLSSDRLPATFDGFRIALFSDLHVGTLPDRKRMLHKLVDTLNSLDADIVINCGDLVNYNADELDSDLVQELSRIESRHGVFAVAGNHDTGIYLRDTSALSREDSFHCVIEKQEEMGWKPLIDQTTCIGIGSDTIAITGLSFPKELEKRSHKPVTDKHMIDTVLCTVSKERYHIVLSHAPQTWDAILESGRGDLTLSGHVHSMQMKLTLGSVRLSPARFFYKRWSGLYEAGGRYLYINDGIGCVLFPLRIGTRPEVTLIELNR